MKQDQISPLCVFRCFAGSHNLPLLVLSDQSIRRNLRLRQRLVFLWQLLHLRTAESSRWPCHSPLLPAPSQRAENDIKKFSEVAEENNLSPYLYLVVDVFFFLQSPSISPYIDKYSIACAWYTLSDPLSMVGKIPYTDNSYLYCNTVI